MLSDLVTSSTFSFLSADSLLAEVRSSSSNSYCCAVFLYLQGMKLLCFLKHQFLISCLSNKTSKFSSQQQVIPTELSSSLKVSLPLTHGLISSLPKNSLLLYFPKSVFLIQLIVHLVNIYYFLNREYETKNKDEVLQLKFCPTRGQFQKECGWSYSKVSTASVLM